MRIGLIAMSGVRAHDPELTRVGLTLPGFVERSKVVASLPSLSLITLAALTPDDVELTYHEVRDVTICDGTIEVHHLGSGPVALSPRRGDNGPAARLLPDGATDRFDLVAISSFSAQIREAYALADAWRARGVPVVMGGLHVSVMPEEALEHATAVVVGEGEPLWPVVIEDLKRGELKRVYRAAPGVYHDLADAPLPRYDLLEVDRYNRLTVQTSRGCPHRCDFCASSILLTPGYHVKPVERVLAEIRAIRAIWPRPFIEFADDNSFARRGHYRRLLSALRGERIKWFTETDISIARDPELLDLMRESGCRQVLIGLESPTGDGLDGIELRRNWKRSVQPDYEAAIRTIQSHGITVNGCFILGLDGHTPEVFEQIHEFVERTGLYEVQLTVLTPFPGTPLYERLEREGRLIEARAWHKCTLFDINHVPSGMTPEELRRGLIDLGTRVYSAEAVNRRRERFFEMLYEQDTPFRRRIEARMQE